MATGVGNGTTVTYGTSSFAGVITGNVSWAQTREAINSSDMSTTTEMTFVPDDLIDPGTLSYEGHFSGDLDPEISTAAETVTVDWAGDSTGFTWAATMFTTSFEATANMGEMMTYSTELKASGAITIA